jgi:hypothetical protein
MTGDTQRDDTVRRHAIADQRLARLDLPERDRPAARRAMAAWISVEEADTLAAHSNAADALAERARIASIVGAGRKLGQARQALRIALLGPITVDQASIILGTLQPDGSASEADLAVPGVGSFGTTAARTERQRIAAIMGHPFAVGRFSAASAIALESNEAVPVQAATALLACLPQEVAKPTIPSIAERAAGQAEFGSEPSGRSSAAETTRSIWGKAVKEANASIGVTPSARPEPVGPDFGGA